MGDKVGDKQTQKYSNRVNVSTGTKECRAECLKNCSCTGFAEMDTHGKGKGCLMWFGPLIDI